MLARFDPFRDFDRVFERAWGPRRHSSMPLDAYRHGDTYVINVDLPGFDPASIDVTAEGDVVSIRAARHWEPVEGDAVVAAERSHGEFFREMLLGEGLDTDNIHASYDNGVLTITVPLLERAAPRRIEVTRADAARPALEAEHQS
jgi:HSP20 family protein